MAAEEAMPHLYKQERKRPPCKKAQVTKMIGYTWISV